MLAFELSIWVLQNSPCPVLFLLALNGHTAVTQTVCSTRKSKMEKAFRTALLYIQKTFCSLYRRWWKIAIQSLQFSVSNLLSPFTLSFLCLEHICESWFLSFMSLFMSLRVYYWLKARMSDRLEVAQDL